MTSGVIPILRYTDAPAAIDFLCRTFGFERQMVVPGENGTVAHAQLVLGGGMIMLGSEPDTEFQRLMRQIDESGRSAVQTTYVVVSDADAHHDRAKAEGAEIVSPLTDRDYGGRDYACRDPEGHVWCFGTYDPWREQSAGA
ncbi:VOC family protein [Marinivivus vitaminiproducens]|uniref:VOC family protein n=1 Tax=Marinivivus vitaminiproducens TaxID=3035935 RepID=UPI0027A06A1E|nr:VOC family protein [Geminicoccaceae bacterium SCSIO 64248]